MKANIKILVLHTRLSGYWMACMRTFVKEYDGSFTVIRKKVSANAPFNFENENGIKLFNFSSFSQSELLRFCKDIDPDLIYVAGWSEKIYLDACQYFYSQGVPVLCGLDNHWQGTLRQRMGKFYLKYIKPKIFTHLWIAGLYQFEYARQLGFNKKNILTGVYSADVKTFSQAGKRKKTDSYPRSFLYVGRFIKRKGLLELAQAFKKLKETVRTDWELTLVGNGPLKKKLRTFEQIEVLDFVQPQKLPNLMSKYGAFVLPSVVEPWGVVVHEAAAAGLPIITTHNCGAATAFVRNGYNGLITRAGSVANLYEALKKTTKLSDEELYTMGERSYELSRQYTPDTWASTIKEVIESQ